MSQTKSDLQSIGAVLGVFLGVILGLNLTPVITSTITTTAAAMSAGTAKSLLELVPLIWVIFLIAIPVVQINLDVRKSMAAGGITIGVIIKVLLPTVVGVTLTGSVVTAVATAVVNLTAGATKTMLELFPTFWVIYLIGIPVTAVAMYFISK